MTPAHDFLGTRLAVIQAPMAGCQGSAFAVALAGVGS
jgi:hypothetical protein